jgi:hypothetical protein
MLYKNTGQRTLIPIITNIAKSVKYLVKDYRTEVSIFSVFVSPLPDQLLCPPILLLSLKCTGTSKQP